MDSSELDMAHATYRQQPTPENLHAVVKKLTPTIHYTLASMNAANDPVIQGKAALVTADAIEKYDPTRGASLPTHVSNQLRQLTREVRKQRNPVNIPERVQLDRYKLEQAKRSFVDKHGRDPDMLELADHTGLPLKRIEKIHSAERAIPTEDAGEHYAASEPDFEKEALSYVYHDSDHTDRRILDMKVGFAGHPTMEAQDIGVVLNLTPAQLSRRSQRLAYKIQKIHESLAKV